MFQKLVEAGAPLEEQIIFRAAKNLDFPINLLNLLDEKRLKKIVKTSRGGVIAL